MGFSKYCLLVLFIFFVQAHYPTCADARPLPFVDQKRYVNVMASLGLECRCCDGAGGECRSTLDASCLKLECNPWKFLRT
ncbi:hypothetical protein MRB53_032848 [Persea americana]|uniref:Uncharacterized protein n=1 Tax=Persea americana TaxID=3435 RepID=A0ACC2KT84_PERAE|nr:hypothetical protein MRB53_032848 [Persea americana]